MIGPMKRPLLITCLAVFAALASPVAAEDAGQRVQDAMVAQLSSQGFSHIRISNTILGRVRIFATKPGMTREIIINPRTGEILRDYWDDEDDDGPVTSGSTVPSTGTSTGTTTRSDDRNDDDGQDVGDDNDDGDDSAAGDDSDDGDDEKDDSEDEKDDDKDDDEDKSDDDDEEDDD